MLKALLHTMQLGSFLSCSLGQSLVKIGSESKFARSSKYKSHHLSLSKIKPFVDTLSLWSSPSIPIFPLAVLNLILSVFLLSLLSLSASKQDIPTLQFNQIIIPELKELSNVPFIPFCPFKVVLPLGDIVGPTKDGL